jgi:hypothetical protein
MEENVRLKFARLAKLKAIAESTKPIYNEMEALAEELSQYAGDNPVEVKLTPSETSFLFNDIEKNIFFNQSIKIVDKFKDQSKVFKNICLSRYEVLSEPKLKE